MDKRNLNWITWGFIVGTVIVVVMMLMNTLHRPEHIILPDTTATSDQIAENPGTDRDALTVVEIASETVQSAIVPAGGLPADGHGGAVLEHRKRFL